jgi:hypothetical protein
MESDGGHPRPERRARRPATGEALLGATSRQGLEGIVAKRRRDPYRPGERGWVKVKHRHHWRFGQELERAQRPGRPLEPVTSGSDGWTSAHESSSVSGSGM